MHFPLRQSKSSSCSSTEHDPKVNVENARSEHEVSSQSSHITHSTSDLSCDVLCDNSLEPHLSIVSS